MLGRPCHGWIGGGFDSAVGRQAGEENRLLRFLGGLGDRAETRWALENAAPENPCKSSQRKTSTRLGAIPHLWERSGGGLLDQADWSEVWMEGFLRLCATCRVSGSGLGWSSGEDREDQVLRQQVLGGLQGGGPRDKWGAQPGLQDSPGSDLQDLSTLEVLVEVHIWDFRCSTWRWHLKAGAVWSWRMVPRSLEGRWTPAWLLEGTSTRKISRCLEGKWTPANKNNNKSLEGKWTPANNHNKKSLEGKRTPAKIQETKPLKMVKGRWTWPYRSFFSGVVGKGILGWEG